MMRYLLETSGRIAIAHENHFLGHFREREGARFYFRPLGDLADDATIRRIVDFIYSGAYQRRSRLRRINHLWRWLPKHVPADELERRLLGEERTERGVFRGFLRAYADAIGERPIIGEKSPAHVRYVDTLLTWFPNARVLHMLRDPRAIYVSDVHRRKVDRTRPYSWFAHVPLLLEAVLLLQTTWTWLDAAGRARELARRWPDRYRLVRFEDLVREPESELAQIFTFLGVDDSPDWVRVTVTSPSLRAESEGIDPQAADRWRGRIGRVPEAWLRLWLGPSMRGLGYDTTSSR